MKIVQLTPGSGDNFYCENCLRDAGLVRAMRERGGDVMMIPMYLPLQAVRGEQVSDGPLFFGGVNVYLQQKMGVFRRTPRWFDKMLDSQRLLGWVGKFAGMTSAKDLGETTISMLLGEDGRQKKELDRLVDWLAEEENRPGVVCLSNALLAGLAEPIKERVGVPVVCMLQDEDGFVDGLGEVYGSRAWEIIREKVKFVDRFVAVSEYYADEMARRLEVGREKFEVVGPGVKVDEYGQAKHVEGGEKVIGFLSQMCKEKGLDILVDAFILLRKDERFGVVKLAMGGGRSRGDEKYFAVVMKKLEDAGLGGEARIVDSFDKGEKLEFLEGLTVMAVPERNAVACGLYVLESFAAGVGVVCPAKGVFKELVEASGAGVLVEDTSAENYAKTIERFLVDSEFAGEMGRKGREAAVELYSVERSAERLLAIFESVAGG